MSGASRALVVVGMGAVLALLPARARAASSAAPREPVLFETRVGREHERGPHHQIVDVLATWRLEDGRLVTRTNPITVLATGLFYAEGGRWLPSREEIELTPDAAVARAGPHRLRSPIDLGTDPWHHLETGDGHAFRWQVLGLSYHDLESGRSVWIAQARPGRAELVAPNKLIYRDAFEGVEADLLFEYTKASFAQDVVLRAQLPEPTQWGLLPERVRLEVVTEFVAVPAPALDREVVWQEEDAARAACLREPILTHDRLRFGLYQMAPGRLFWVNGTTAEDEPELTTPVLHRWETIGGRTVLLEHLEYEAIRPLLRELPPPQTTPGRGLGQPPIASAECFPNRQLWLAATAESSPEPDPSPPACAKRSAAGRRPSPLRGERVAEPGEGDRFMFTGQFSKEQVASAEPRRRTLTPARSPSRDTARGLVLDWTLSNASQENVTLRGDSTYLVAGIVNLSGTTTIEGGTVVKYTNNGIARLNLEGDLVCQTAPYRPAVFTANADDSVGEVTPRGALTDYYAKIALRMPASGSTLAHVRVARARTALQFPPTVSGAPCDRVQHVQLVNCQNGIVTSGTRFYQTILRRTLYLGDGLLTRDVRLRGTSKAVSGSYYQGTLEQLTLDGWSYLAQAGGSSASSLSLRNSVFARVANLGEGPRLRLRDSVCNGFYATPPFGAHYVLSPVDPFTTVGDGRYYLQPGSPFLNRGTNAIQPALRENLRRRTVYPPLARGTDKPFALDTVLGRTAPCDDDGRLDLGYHYAPLDWCWGGLSLAGTNGPAALWLTNGVTVGVQGNLGTVLLDGARFLSEGSPTNLNRLVRCASVQEQSTNAGSAGPWRAFFSVRGAYSSTKEVRLRFTEINATSGQQALFDDQTWLPLGALSLQDCQVQGVGLTLSLYPAGGAGATLVALTNNLCRRVAFNLNQDTEAGRPKLVVQLRNNRFEGGRLELADYSGTGSWGVYDNEFYNLEKLTAEAVPNAHNAYSGAAPLPGSGGGDVLYSVATTRAGPAAGDLDPARLIDAGSRHAATAGLYHYRNPSAATAETDSQVDIGYHEVTTGENQVADTDGDGLPDYVEDTNGNGQPDDALSWTEACTHPNPAGYNDLQALEGAANILVTDPAQDYANEQNTQYQPSVVVRGDTVVVGYWDSNRGIYGLASLEGEPLCRMVAYSVSRDGGRTFADRDVPPLPEGATYGDAGDPVLAVDRASGVIYYAATSERKSGTFRGIPFWKSTDGGITFENRSMLWPEITGSDYPWIAVDDWPGPGQHDVYAVISGSINNSGRRQWLTVSRDGAGGSWSFPVGLGASSSVIPHLVVGADHVAYVAWNERAAVQSLQICSLRQRGAVIGPVHTIRELRAPDSLLRLRRSNTATNAEDWFKGFCLPTLAVNPDPARSSHLYVTYADRGVQDADRADVFFVHSTNGGVTWSTNAVRVNLDEGRHDQWTPALAVRPDGNRLFIGWHDRRQDPNNSLIEVYGRWASIAADGQVSFFTNDFRISTEPFPPVFSGAVPEKAVPGHYDPVWAPGDVNLNWWYPWWPEFDDWGEPVLTSSIYSHEAGEHNGAAADAHYAYLVWSDNRTRSQATRWPGRNQTDIRLARIPWPPF